MGRGDNASATPPLFDVSGPSAGSTIVANVAIATSPALLGAPVLCVKIVVYCMQGWMLESKCKANSPKGALYFTHVIHHTETLFAESKLNFSFCMGICFCVKGNFTL